MCPRSERKTSALSQHDIIFLSVRNVKKQTLSGTCSRVTVCFFFCSYPGNVFLYFAAGVYIKNKSNLHCICGWCAQSPFERVVLFLFARKQPNALVPCPANVHYFFLFLLCLLGPHHPPINGKVHFEWFLWQVGWAKDTKGRFA